MKDNYFTILWWFWHSSTWIGHRYTYVPRNWTPLSPLSPPYPSRLFQSMALGALLHVLNSHWSSILHMVMHMFQHYYLKSSHLLLLPLSSKVCSLCLSPLLPCMLDHRYYLSKFHIYVLKYTVFVSLFRTYFTLYNRFQVHPPH